MNATMSLENVKHYPVMLDQVLSIISPQHGGTFIDCTFGGGGYSKAILKYPNTKVLAIDRDKFTKDKANKLLSEFPSRFTFYQDKFSNLENIVKSNLKPKAIIFDLGLSSFQLSDYQRGFSFLSENSLSMQMGLNTYSAYDVVNNLDKKNLTQLIKILGDEKDGKLIANKIIKYRTNKSINTAKELSSIINDAKKNYKKNNKNLSTKTFQAIRIFVNKELSELFLGLIAATKLLSEGGILIIVSFHSLEDRIVKHFFKLYSDLNQNPSRYVPLKKDKFSLFSKILKKPLTPNEREVSQNIRSRSAKLRYAFRNKNSFFYPEKFQQEFEKYFQLEEIRL